MKKVEIYTKNYCPYCHRAKELLRIKGIPFIEYDVTADVEKEREMQQRSGARTVPQIFVAGTGLGGCSELFELDEKGELDQLLGLKPPRNGSS
ncbi:MAG: glutaredoxin 3 [Desulfuromonadales bacterium]|uniref:glutaredoxin 3 n=1 Tax=Desulfuromonas sp. KJ2020 TaxID=2919173 RepID=UPI0020A836DA|nr:glutaredoxin 3 [Desulfuromonas sp. KJ2020]MCP3175916.1 glutaredoxin 3 [Desulfuromonas sp. KJ2020]